MIDSFKSGKLKRLYHDDDPRGLSQNDVPKIRRILARLDQITEPSGMGLPGYALHPLKGSRKGQWAVKVSANWRIVFRVEGGNVHDVELCDYH